MLSCCVNDISCAYLTFRCVGRVLAMSLRIRKDKRRVASARSNTRQKNKPSERTGRIKLACHTT
ncbi:hypothetical protein X777_15039 [Ooceraea biroi]|uniref:Uncharacterized protein n=1 Tax=Ooceraea biroi TaxID=2015173 RepID=A0A026VWA9_OOCBI|nr:hypothetical protein X777_15039 [Ooceraea biroi]